MLWWRGPDWGARRRTRSGACSGAWVVVAIGLNLLSVVARALAWGTVMQPGACRRLGRAFRTCSRRSRSACWRTPCCRRATGELARVAVLARRLPRGARRQGDARRGRSSRTASSTSSPRCCSSSTCSDGEDPATGRSRAWPSRPRSAAILFVLRAHHVGASAAGARGAEPAAASARRWRGTGSASCARPLASPLAIFFQCLGWLLPAVRGVDVDEGVRHRRAAAGGGLVLC